MSRLTRKRSKPKKDDSFEAVAKRLGYDDKDRFEAKLGKLAKAKPKSKSR